MRLLITGFGDFEGGPNCSEILLAALAADQESLQAAWVGPVAFARFDVDAETIERQLADALAAHRPSHLLLMGQAASRAPLSFERVARNVRDLKIQDDAGRIGPLGPVRRGGPEARRATWPRLAACAAAAAEGAPAALSDDAGTHLCNQALYLALEAAEAAASALAVTFLHLPLLPEQIAAGVPAAARAPSGGGPSLAEMKRAVAAFLRHTRRDLV
jgi:pyroglutamyl-peptidase